LAWSGQPGTDWVCDGHRPSSGLCYTDPGSGSDPIKKKKKREKERKEKRKEKEKENK